MLAMLSGCACAPLAEDFEGSAVARVDLRPYPVRDAGTPIPRFVPLPCIATASPARCSAEDRWIFDGARCRPGCAPLEPDGGAAYADEVSCLTACACATDKWRQDFLPTTECQYVYSVGSLDAGVPAGCRALTRAYNCIFEFPLDGGSWGGGVMGPVIGTEGVRLACELSLLPGVEDVVCSVWGE